jgi:GTP-binding protein EngB required for normal cell division
VRADLMVNFFKYTPIALCLFLIDVRRGLGPLDQQVYNLVEPFVKRKNIIFLLTKGDKVLKRKYDENAAHKAEIKWASASGVSLDEVRLISNSWEDSWLGLRDLIRKKVLD